MAYLNGNKILMGANVAMANLPIDQTYNPESENAQSGKAVAQAVANLGGGSDYELLTENTLSTDAYINITLPFPCRSVFIDFSKVGSNQGEQYWWINNKSGGKFSFSVRKPSNTLQSPFYEIEFTLENGLCTVTSDYATNTYTASTTSRVARYVGDTDTALTGVRSATPYLSGTSYKVYVRRT